MQHGTCVDAVRVSLPRGRDTFFLCVPNCGHRWDSTTPETEDSELSR